MLTIKNRVMKVMNYYQMNNKIVEMKMIYLKTNFKMNDDMILE